MEITFPLTADDHWRFTQFVTRRTPAMRRASLVRIVFLPALLTVEFLLLRLPLLVLVPLLIVLTAAWVLYLNWARKNATGRMARMRLGSVGLHTLRIGAEGLRQQDTVMESFVRWEKIMDITQSPHHIAFFMGPGYAFIVPLSAFRDGEQANAFLETAKAYRRSARDGSSAPAPPENASWPPPPQRMA